MLQSDPIKPLPNLFTSKFSGFPIGYVIKDGSITNDSFIYPVLARGDSHNESILIEGSSGSGKNFLAFLLGVKYSLAYNQPVFFFDLKGDYRGSNKIHKLFSDFIKDSRVFVPYHYLASYGAFERSYYEVTDALKLKSSLLTPEMLVRLGRLDPKPQYNRFIQKAFREVDTVSLQSVYDKVLEYQSTIKSQNIKNSLDIVLSGIEYLMEIGVFSDDGLDFDQFFNKSNKRGIYVFSFAHPDSNRFDYYGILLNQLFEYTKKNLSAYPIVILDELKLSAPSKRFRDEYTDYSSLSVSYVKEMGRAHMVRIFLCQSVKDLLESFTDSPCPITFTFYDRRKCRFRHDIKKILGYLYVGECPLSLKT